MRPSSLVLFWPAANLALLGLYAARPRWRELLFLAAFMAGAAASASVRWRRPWR